MALRAKAFARGRTRRLQSFFRTLLDLSPLDLEAGSHF
jgi:hypothetical protein